MRIYYRTIRVNELTKGDIFISLGHRYLVSRIKKGVVTCRRLISKKRDNGYRMNKGAKSMERVALEIHPYDARSESIF